MTVSYRSGKGWYVCYCSPQQLKRAKSGIIELGHDVYIPMEKYRKPVRGKMQTLERPLLGPYLFFSLDPHKDTKWPSDVDGVEYVLSNDGVPSRVPGIWIEAMRKSEAYGEFDRTPDSPQPFKIGETARISDGLFSGYHAVIEEFIAKLRSSKGSKRAKVVLDFFGRKMMLELPVRDLERVA